MSIHSVSLADLQKGLSARLLLMLDSLKLSQRALAQNLFTLSDSALRNALLSSVSETNFARAEGDLSSLKQMNHVAMKLQLAVDTINDRSKTSAAILEAAIAIFDAQSVIAGSAPAKEFADRLEAISGAYLSPEVIA